MANTVIALKKSATPSAVPTSLANGELAINFADGKLYYKAANGTIASISGSGGGAAGDSFGIVNANGTIILSDTSGDTLTILPGDFITVTGDAINDRITIGANVKVVYDVANAAYENANAISTAANNYAGAMANAANAIATATFGTITNTTAAFAAANQAGVIANAAFAAGNNEFTFSNTVYAAVNSAFVVLNAAFSKANNALANTSSVSFNGDLFFPTGNVGIGTTLPLNRLHVNGSVRANAGSFITYSTSGTDYAVYGSSSFNFGQNNAFRSTISHSGNESIQFTSYGQMILALSGVDFTPSVQILAGKSFGWGSTGSQSNNPNLVFWNESANVFAQRNGTAGQTYRLYGTYTDGSNNERLRISANTTAHYIIGEENGTGLARPLYLGTNNSTSLTIDASGNVGIGTISPAYKLDVIGSANISNPTLLVAGTNVLASFAAANNYAGDMANSGNAITYAVVSANLDTARAYTNTSTTAANNYAGAMANSSNTFTGTVYAAVNSSFGVINAAFTQSNTDNVRLSAAYVVVNSAFGSVNTVGGFANTAGSQANQAGVIANTAFGAANQAGVVANNANTYGNSTYIKKAGDTITGDLVVQGNVTISGNTTYANSQTLLIGDALITLNNDIPAAVAPSEDAGIEIKRGSSANVSILWNEGSDRWTFTNDGTNYRLIASNTDVESANNYAGAMANSGNAITYTVVSANLDTARAYTNTSTGAANNYAGVMANSANAIATATFGTITNTTAAFAAANQAGVIANAAFAAGNNEFTFSNTIYAAVNSAFGVINASFTQSNTDNVRLSAAYVSINAGYTVANAAFGKANGAVQTAYVGHLISGTTTLTPSSNNATINIGAGNVVTLVANTTNNAVIITLPASGVTATTYGNSTIIPVITVDAFGRITSASNTTLTSTGLANTSGISFNGDLFFPTGNVAVGASSATFNSVAYRLYVNGAFAATTKSFVINHPTKSGMKLRYGSLEGPENGVYVRGKVEGKVIELPDYWTGLVDEDTITVQLTAIGRSQGLYVVEVIDNKVFIDSENHTEPHCYYTVYGERKDVEKLVVEY